MLYLWQAPHVAWGPVNNSLVHVMPTARHLGTTANHLGTPRLTDGTSRLPSLRVLMPPMGGLWRCPRSTGDAVIPRWMIVPCGKFCATTWGLRFTQFRENSTPDDAKKTNLQIDHLGLTYLATQYSGCWRSCIFWNTYMTHRADHSTRR